MEEPDGIRSATNAGNQTNLGTRASGVPVSAKSRRDACVPRELRACFASNHALKFAYHQRIWMRTERAAKQIISIGNISHPVTQRFVNRVFQSARTRINFTHFRAEQTHAKDIQGLSPHVFRSHIHDTLQTK